ncbi:putative metalloprotease CJM1_0395 family protein [Thiohalorhabdus sp.]|uniref:putative metalloprotease CJM1_0395 family protein n=1 Tax=Thiohalorhabdus sp. TaxID=3094134 RepID=UPI002FC34035
MDLSIYNPSQFPRPAAQSGAWLPPRSGAPNGVSGGDQARPAETGRATTPQDGPEGSWRSPPNRQTESNAHPDTQEQQRARELQARDREVRSHEAAHLATAGPYAEGGAQLQFRQGPDNRFYAVGGEVQLDTSRPEDPDKALHKAETLVQSALAPAEPSSQDLRVAAQARAMAAGARAELQQEGGGGAGEANRSDSAYRRAAEGDSADRSGRRLDRMI